jgi:hypothetical protein
MLYQNVHTDRQMRATTGLSLEAFGKLSELFASNYQACHEISLKKKLENLSQRTVLASYEAMLFFVLFQLKNGLTYDVLGCIYGMDASTAQRNFERHLRILRHALRQLQVLPKRGFEKVEELEEYLRAEQHLLIDATEIPIQRPVSQDEQKRAYSGKKKPIG